MPLLKRTSRYVPHALFLLLACALFICDLFLLSTDHEKLYADIVKDIGVVIAALAVTDLLWRFVGGDPVTNEIDDLRNRLEEAKDMFELSRHAKQAGFTYISPDANKGNEQWLGLLSKSKQNVDICGIDLRDLIRESSAFRKLLAQKLEQRVNVRILLCDPKANFLDTIFGKQNELSADIEATIIELKELVSALPKEPKAKFSMRLMRNRVLQCGIRRFDDEINVMSYLQSKKARETPIFAINGPDTPLFKAYREEFDFLFDLAEKAIDGAHSDDSASK